YPEQTDHRFDVKRNFVYDIGIEFQHDAVRKEIKKNRKTSTPKELNCSSGQMTFTPFFGSLLSANPPLETLFRRAASNLSIHLLHRARNLVGNMCDLDVAHDLFDLRRHPVGLRDHVAQAHSLANNFQIRAARTAVML